MSHELVDSWSFTFLVEMAAVAAGRSGEYLLAPGAPLYMVNKANLGDRDRRRGSERWQEVKAFEAAIHLAAAAAKKDQGLDAWPMDARGFHVHVEIHFGDRVVDVTGKKAQRKRAAKRRAQLRKAIENRRDLAPLYEPTRAFTPHTRRDTSIARCEAYGCDSIKAVLDALQGVAYVADEQADSQSSRKVARNDGQLGDRLRITVDLAAGVDAGAADRGRSDSAAASARRSSSRSETVTQLCN